MNTENLLEQANLHIVKINGIMRSIEEYETTLQELSREEIEVCVTDKKQVSYLSNVLDQDALKNIKDSLIAMIKTEHNGRKTELSILLGREPVAESEPAQEIDTVEEKLKVILEEESKAIKESKPEMTVEEVKRLYHDENKTLKEIADYYGVKKTAVNNFVYRNGLARKHYKNDGFRDKEVEERRKQKQKQKEESP